MALFSAIAIVLVSILTAIYIYFKHNFNYWKQRGIPHESPIFPYGNIKDFGGKYHQSTITKRIYDKFKGVAPFCGVYILAGRVAMITSLDLLKHILVKDFSLFSDKGLYTNDVDEPLMSNLFFQDGEKWRKFRTKLTPTFTSGKMKFMFPTVIAVAEQLRLHLLDVVEQKGVDVVEIKDILARFTTDVIGTCAFGIECNSLNDPNAEFKRMGEKAFIPKYPVAVQMAINGLKQLARKLHVKVLHADVAEFFLNAVKETVEYRRKNNIQRNDFLDILMKLNESDGALTLNEMAAQSFLFFLAGFETSSSTLQFCLYELALNQEIQAKARKAIEEAYKKHGQFTYEMMMDMPYIDHVLHETLRLYPPISVINRFAKIDYQVPGTKHVIEKGTNILVPNYAIQRDADYFPNPEKFDPNRFESDEMHKRNPLAWLPFGEGPRNCIGLRFGMMQARIGLVTLLNNFEFSLNKKTIHPIQYVPRSFILTPKGGVYLNLKKVNKIE